MKHTEPVRVSIIVPMRNEAKYIGACLESILAQDYPHNLLEVWMVDGGSIDQTREIVAGFSQRADFVHLLDNPEQTTPHAMNYGLKAAQGDVIIIVGGHCTLAPDYIRHCVRLLQETDAACVGGLLTSQGEGWLSQSIAMAMSSPFGVGNARFRYATEAGFVDTVAFGAYRREVFETIGVFNPELTRNQDDELNYRLRQAGFKIYLSPEIQSVYYTRSSLGKLWKQYFQYGFWKIRVLRDYPGSVQARHLIPGLFVLGLSKALLGAPFHRHFRTLLKGILLPYVLASLFFGWKRCRQDIKYLPGVLTAFPILHLAYGSGFWWGLWQFLRSGQNPKA